MMDDIKGYLMTIICTGIICGVACKLMESKGASSALVKMLAGIIMTVTMIMPITNLDFTGISRIQDAYSSDAQYAVSQGIEQSKQAFRDGIMKRCEEYVLKEAQRLDLSVAVNVYLSDDDLPVPVRVTINGNASPYGKSALLQSVCTAFDLKKENVEWT